MKHNNLCLKLDAPLTEAECRKILAGDTDFMLASPHEPVRELYCKMKTEQLRPRVLVSYVREPYVFAPGNIRVTFDSEIRSTLYHGEFLEETVHDIPATDRPGDIILEVKFDEFLPDIIASLIQCEGVRQQAFSKYGICRRFG